MTNPIAILLIEDNPGDAGLVREWLKVAPADTYRLEHVERLTAGLDRLQEDRFDVVLLDLGLPDSQGLDGLSRVLDTTPEMAVLVLTAQQDEQVGLQAVKQGAQDFLLKGKMNGAALFRTIRYAVERQRSEEELRRANALLSAIIEGTTDRIFAKDSDGRFLLFNHAASAFIGKISAEVRGKDDIFLFPPEEAQAVMEADRRVMESGTTSTFEEELTSSSGETRTFLSTKGPIADDHGEVVGLFGISRDITDMKRSQDQIRESGERYRLLFESMPAGMAHCRMIYDRDGEPQDFIYLDVNESLGRLTGLTDIVGKRVTDVVPGIRESNPELFDIYGRVARGGDPERFETYVEGFGWLDVSAYSPMAEQFIAVVDDATARKEAEAAHVESESNKKANDAKTEFLSRMSHELRTPLNAILGFGQLLEMDDLGSENDADVQRIMTAGRQLLELIEDILDISRIEAGTLDISTTPVPVREMLVSVADLMAPMAAKAGVTVTVDGAVSQDAHTLANPRGLRQVLLNLVSNAIKYNVPGGTVLMTAEEDGDRVLIGVSDTGAGIPLGDLPRVWAPFDRLGAERRGIQGTGLGLSVSKELVEAMGGSISVTSEVGKGSHFTVDLGWADSPPPASP